MKPSGWIAIAAIVVIATLGFLYIGATHRDRCIKAGNTGCTILPWSGHSGYLLPGSASSGGWGGGAGWGTP